MRKLAVPSYKLKIVNAQLASLLGGIMNVSEL
jgi:hypothetical protein